MALGKGKYNYKHNATFTSLKDDKTFGEKNVTLRYFWGHGKRGGIMAGGFPRLPLKEWKFNDSKKTINYGKGFIVIKCSDEKNYEMAKQAVLRKKPAKKKTTTKRKASPVRKKLSQRKKAPKKSGRILRGKRNSPSTSATSVSVGTKRRGGDGKMYVCKTYKRGNKRVKRWFKV